jgi:hypothetical protein
MRLCFRMLAALAVVTLHVMGDLYERKPLVHLRTMTAYFRPGTSDP